MLQGYANNTGMRYSVVIRERYSNKISVVLISRFKGNNTPTLFSGTGYRLVGGRKDATVARRSTDYWLSSQEIFTRAYNVDIPNNRYLDDDSFHFEYFSMVRQSCRCVLNLLIFIFFIQ